jgi:hypothetical protein
MIALIKKIFTSEFLPVTEVRKLKVHIVMGFLFVITLITIPFSIFFEYSLLVKVLSLLAFVLTYALCILLVKFNKIFTAIQITMIYSVSMTVFYALGISSFYAYIFFYISMTIIIFYQEIYSYFIYGTLTLALGILYTLSYSQGDMILQDVQGAIYIYLAGLVIYYLVSFVQIVNNEKLYADMNIAWVKLNNINSNYQDELLYFIEDIRSDMKQSPIYENEEFQKVAFELSEFVAQQILKDGKEIVNLIDLYIYIHEKGLDEILKNKEISVSMKKTANSLGKYLINQNTDMFSLLISFYLQFQKTPEFSSNRYIYNLDKLTNLSDEQIIAFCLIYLYLFDELIISESWHRRDNHDLEMIYSNIDLSEFFSEQVIAFYKENKDLLKKYTRKN